MTHFSKITNKIYDISFSASIEDSKLKFDDITLIWDAADPTIPHMLVGWYYGDYDFDTTEDYIRRHNNVSM